MRIFNFNNNIFNGINKNSIENVQDLQLFQMILLSLLENLNMDPDNKFIEIPNEKLLEVNNEINNVIIDDKNSKQFLEDKINDLVSALINLFLMENSNIEIFKADLYENFKNLKESSRFFLIKDFFNWLKEKLDNNFNSNVWKNSKKVEFFEDLKEIVKDYEKNYDYSKSTIDNKNNEFINFKHQIQILKNSLVNLISRNKDSIDILTNLVKNEAKSNFKDLKPILESFMKDSKNMQIFHNKEDSKDSIINNKNLRNRSLASDLILDNLKISNFKINKTKNNIFKSKINYNNFDIKFDDLKNINNIIENSDEKIISLFKNLFKNKESKFTGFINKNNKIINFNNFWFSQTAFVKLNNDKVIKLEKIKLTENSKISKDFLQFIKDMSLELLPEGEKRAFIKLEPPDLGTLNLEIKIKDRDVSIIARVDKPEVLTELKNNIHHIKNSLQETGLILKDYQFYLADGSNPKYFENFTKKKNRHFEKIIDKSNKIEEITSNKNINSVFINKNGKIYYIV